MENIDYNDSDSESVDEIENFPILNFDNDTYQNIKDKILQLDGDDNEDYDLNSEIEEIILHDEYGKGTRETDCNEKHDDLTRVLETFGNWIQLVAKSDNIIQKQQLIWLLLPAVESLKSYLPRELLYKPINPDPSERFVMPTLLITRIAFRLAKIDLSIKAKAASLKENECTYFGNLLGESLWQSRILLKDNLPILENPQSLVQYASSYYGSFCKKT
ncbi:10650_t:CDS:2 [Racocetra fulgida]|uniref:10649_t:CDS:1 n=1 Tax=Racocetra fulgida TaxID=60492 RepID=A0A9N9G7P8_9GLOM|nr:10649_t:CDS:2 [Racocetra fulgida]CAG8583198.1 10650_t:CDS:2 [Racocetra fulgida]